LSKKVDYVNTGSQKDVEGKWDSSLL